MLITKNIIVVIPVGPNSSAAFVTDTIESYLFYASGTSQVVIMDDSQQGIGEAIAKELPGIVVLKTKKKMGGWAGLYISLAEAYYFALKHYTFKAILKLDTDALVINKAQEKEALTLFESNEKIGIAGQYPNEYDGTPWDIAWPKQRIINTTQTWKFFARPIAHWLLKKQYSAAVRNGYRTGESVFGGAYFMSYALVKTLADKGLLPNRRFKTLNLGEDHLFAILATGNGFSLRSLSNDNQPFACAWKDLPAAPEKMYKEGRKVIHSVRGYGQLDEAAIRTFFKMKRKEEKINPSPSETVRVTREVTNE